MSSFLRYLATPSLSYDEKAVTKNQYYYLRFRKGGGEGKVENCEGRVSILGTDITTLTVWEHPNGIRVTNIGDYNDLRLFRILDDAEGKNVEPMLLFTSTDQSGKLVENDFSYEEFKDNILRVTVTATKGRCPHPYEKKISEIVADARRQRAE